jgi:hypothetical protein
VAPEYCRSSISDGRLSASRLELVENPLQVRRNITRELHPPPVAGMLEGQACGMEERSFEVRHGAQVPGYSAVEPAVERIADDWMTDCTEVDADLMRPPGLNRDVHQRQGTDRFGADDSRNRLAAPAGSGRRSMPISSSRQPGRHFVAVHGVSTDRCIDASSRLHDAPYEGDVFLLHLPIVKLAGEFVMSRVVLGYHHQAGGAAIEPMHDSGPFLASDAAQIRDVMKQRVDQRPTRVARGRMYDHSGRLVDDDEVLVLVPDLEGQRFRPRDCVDRLGQIDADGLARLDRLVRFRLATGKTNMAFLDQALNLRSRVLGENRRQKAVEPDTFAVLGDRDSDVMPPFSAPPSARETAFVPNTRA